MKIPKHIEMLIKYVSAGQAYEIISTLGNPNVNVFQEGLLVNIKDIANSDEYRYCPARTIGPLLFWGGPPDHLNYYKGTLYTLLCDRLLDTIDKNGEQAARESICGCQTRIKATV
jgi:hypothetical protein